jgi:MFS family permease
MACEGTVYDWSSLYLKEVLHVAAQQQGIAYFAYLCTMVSGRFIIDRLVNRWGAFRILLTCSLAITLGFLITVLSPTLPTLHLTATVFGFALIGCGTSAIVPLCCSLAGSCKTLSPGIAIAEISTIGFFGFLVMPPSIGYIASAMGLRIAFAFVLLISLPVIIATLRLKRLA